MRLYLPTVMIFSRLSTTHQGKHLWGPCPHFPMKRCGSCGRSTRPGVSMAACGLGRTDKDSIDEGGSSGREGQKAPSKGSQAPSYSFALIHGSSRPEAIALNAEATKAPGPYAIHWHHGPVPSTGQVFCLYHLLLSAGSAQRSL